MQPCDPVATSLIVLGVMLAAASLRTMTVSEPVAPPLAAIASVNANTAPWWELAALPDIGETTARQIVAYRSRGADGRPAFTRPSDLEPVSGIGPKTIRRISPYLRFSD